MLSTYVSTYATEDCAIIDWRVVGSGTTNTDNSAFNNPATLDTGEYYAVPLDKNQDDTITFRIKIEPGINYYWYSPDVNLVIGCPSSLMSFGTDLSG
jgi:hypothetical protein